MGALRTWTSVTGKFKIEARFVHFEDDVLTLDRKSERIDRKVE